MHITLIWFYVTYMILCFLKSAVVLPKVLVRAENLTAAFSVYMGNVTGLFSWVVAMPQPPQQVTGYQVTWAEVITESRINNLPNSLISQSQILPPVSHIQNNWSQVDSMFPCMGSQSTRIYFVLGTSMQVEQLDHQTSIKSIPN